MAKSKKRFTNFFYILVTLFLVLIAKVQSEDAGVVKRRIVAMCPPDFQRIRTECYHISSNNLTWLEAHFECKSRNGKLAEPTRIQDAAIRKFLLNKYGNMNKDVIYFGGMYDHRAQVWSWGVSGQKFNYSSFIGLKTYLKRKSLNHTCTVYNPNRKFRWTPRDCTENHRFICEHKMPKVTENNRDKVYQKWNMTYPNQIANEVVMEVRDDDRRNNSRRVKVIPDSGEVFFLKKTPRQIQHQPLFKRPTYNTPTPPIKRPDNYVQSDNPVNSVNPPAGNNEILKPPMKPKKDRTRSKFDREVAKQRRLERSRQRAAKKEERLRKLREKEELKERKKQEQLRNNELKRLELRRQQEASERKRLEDERLREEETRKSLEEAKRLEEEERLRLMDAKRREEQERERLENERVREEQERQRLEDERRLQDEEEGKRKKRLEEHEFIPEVITEDYREIEQHRIQKQQEIERLNKEIAEKYEREQAEELERRRMMEEKRVKELEEKELTRRAEEQRHREEKERERQEQIRLADEARKQIEREKEMEDQRRKEEEENQKRLEEEKRLQLEEEKREQERKEREERERQKEEEKRRAELQKKIDSEKDKVIEEEIQKEENRKKKEQALQKFAKLSPEQRAKFLALKRAQKAKKANEVTNDDKK